jgi:hypothetical protein
MAVFPPDLKAFGTGPDPDPISSGKMSTFEIADSAEMIFKRFLLYVFENTSPLIDFMKIAVFRCIPDLVDP